jgi:hypothetical protein
MTTKRQLAEILADTDKRIGTHAVKVARLMEFTHGALLRKLDRLTSN